jgi:nicotinamide-nucleotide amidase
MAADNLSNSLHRAALELGASLLAKPEEKVVFAESCTAGLVAAALARVPGISQSLCGSLVTYREASKIAWLGVEPQLLSAHTAVSAQVTAAMARGALNRTVEAKWAIAVTGHLGPGAPTDLDGQIFVAVARRLPPGETGDPEGTPAVVVLESQRRLTAEGRSDRQQQAAQWVLESLGNILAEHSLKRPPSPGEIGTAR